MESRTLFLTYNINKNISLQVKGNKRQKCLKAIFECYFNNRQISASLYKVHQKNVKALLK